MDSLIFDFSENFILYLIKCSDFGKYIDIWRAVCYTERVGGMAMIERKNYLEKLIAWKDEKVI